jgi:hypothetical protein
VRLVIPGIFEYWMRQNGKWGGLNKMPRCRRDRQIDDELASITKFTPGAPWGKSSRAGRPQKNPANLAATPPPWHG